MSEHDHMVFPAMELQALGGSGTIEGNDDIIGQSEFVGIHQGREVHAVGDGEGVVDWLMRCYLMMGADLELSEFDEQNFERLVIEKLAPVSSHLIYKY